MKRRGFVPAAAAALALALVQAACGGGQTRIGKVFDTEWQDDAGRSIAAVQQRLAAVPVDKGANVAVGVVASGLRGLPLDGGAAWKADRALDARPFVAGNLVVGSGGGAVFALDALTGRTVWERPTGGVVRGAGDDGRTTVVMLTPSSNRGGVLLAIGRDGTVARQLEVDVPVGRPALVANLAFIPWQNQYVTVYDLASGDEVARVTLRHQTSHAFVTDGALYFGEVGLTRFDDKIGAGSRGKASHVDLPARELPGAPRWMRQGGVVPKRLADASDRIAIFARPASGGEKLGVDNDRFYATYFHAVLGLKASSGELAWVRSSTHDVIAGAAYAGGVVVCDDKGGVAMFDAAAGSEAGKLSFGQPLQSCVVQADTLERRASKAGAEPLVHQISQAIDTKETEMVMMQRFLLRELVAQSSELATKRLVELASDPRTSPVLLKDARDGLSARRNGTSYMMQALARRYDFLADVLVAPPVAPIADALAAMDEKSAADSLLEHLLDPSTPEDDVKHAAMALQKLAAPRHLEGLQTFLQLNRCTADDEAMVEAVVTVARTLLRVGGVEAAKLVAAAAERATTTAPLKPLLAELVRTASPERPRPR